MCIAEVRPLSELEKNILSYYLLKLWEDGDDHDRAILTALAESLDIPMPVSCSTK